MSGAKFNDTQFDGLVKEYGYLILVEKHMVCPCVSQENPDASPTCPICHGLHYTWRPYGVIQALVYNVKEGTMSLDMTKVSVGDKTITTRYVDKLSLNDRIRLIHTQEVYSERLDEEMDEQGNPSYVPYYDVAEFESAIDLEGNPIPLEAIRYDSAADRIYVKHFRGPISFRYRYYPYFLISDLLHSNRQQWTGEAGKGRLMQLPNQYFAKRITTKLQQSSYPSLIESSLLYDFTPKESSVNHSTSFNYDTPLSFSLNALDLKAALNYASLLSTQDFTLEVFFRADHPCNLFSFEEIVGSKFDIRGVISSSSQILDLVKPKDIFLYLSDKYLDERVLCEGDSNMLIQFKGGDPLERANWQEVLPKCFDTVRPEEDFRGEEPAEYAFDRATFEWHKVRNPFSILYSDGSIKAFNGLKLISSFDASITEQSNNYLALLASNRGQYQSFQLYLNGSLYQFTGTAFAEGLLYRRILTVLGSKQAIKRLRLYSRKLDSYELQSNMKVLINEDRM